MSHIIEDKNMEFNLVYANKKEEDILLRDRLEQLGQKINLKNHFVLENLNSISHSSLNYSHGFITKEVIHKNLPKPNDNVLIIVCCSKIMAKDYIFPMLKELEYNEDNIIIL